MSEQVVSDDAAAGEPEAADAAAVTFGPDGTTWSFEDAGPDDVVWVPC